MGGSGGWPRKASRAILPSAKGIREAFASGNVLKVAHRVKAMPQISFNAKALGVIIDPKSADVSGPMLPNAVDPVVMLHGVPEALKEIMGFTDIDRIVGPNYGDPLARDVDPRKR